MIPAIEVYSASDKRADTDTLVGICRFTLRRGSISSFFSYDDRYLASPSAYAIDPRLPLAIKSASFDGLPGCFRDSSPDRWGRHLVARRAQEEALLSGERACTLDEVDYLLGVFDSSRQGALRFRLPGSSEYLSPKEEIPPIMELKALIAASNLVAKGTEGRQQLKELLDAGSGSLGGARPKASVTDEDKLLLAKFSHPGDIWDVMGWEKTSLDIARASGLDVPTVKLVRLGEESALLLERFDREGSLITGGRVPYISAMTLLEAEDGSDNDYADVAEAAADWCDDALATLHELFDRVVLSIALHNTDDHLRNLGFIRERGRWRLAPVFDVNIEPDSARERVTGVFGERGSNEVQGLKELASICALDDGEAALRVRHIVAAVRQWKGFAARNGCRERERALLGRVVEERCTALEKAFF